MMHAYWWLKSALLIHEPIHIIDSGLAITIAFQTDDKKLRAQFT